MVESSKKKYRLATVPGGVWNPTSRSEAMMSGSVTCARPSISKLPNSGSPVLNGMTANSPPTLVGKRLAIVNYDLKPEVSTMTGRMQSDAGVAVRISDLEGDVPSRAAARVNARDVGSRAGLAGVRGLLQAVDDGLLHGVAAERRRRKGEAEVARHALRPEVRCRGGVS